MLITSTFSFTHNVFLTFPKQILNFKSTFISLVECDTILSAYTLYRYLGQYCTHPSILSSANGFNLDQSKILSFRKELSFGSTSTGPILASSQKLQDQFYPCSNKIKGHFQSCLKNYRIISTLVPTTIGQFQAYLNNDRTILALSQQLQDHF